MSHLFTKPIKDMSDEELEQEVDKIHWEMIHIPLGELTKRSLNKLQKIIQEFNEQSSKQTQKIVFLTRCIVGLTIAMLVGLLIQIWLVIKQTDYAELQSRSDRISQNRSIQEARERCEKLPELQESGLYYISNGKSVPCSEVLENYKNN